jgi:cytochrome c oxidase subunit IV
MSRTGHIVPERIYFAVFAALLVLTATTVGVSFIDLGDANVAVALIIAVVKATLVILFFMHLRYSTRLTWLTIGAALFWLSVMILLTMSDVVSRGWLGFPGK